MHDSSCYNPPLCRMLVWAEGIISSYLVCHFTMLILPWIKWDVFNYYVITLWGRTPWSMAKAVSGKFNKANYVLNQGGSGGKWKSCNVLYIHTSDI